MNNEERKQAAQFSDVTCNNCGKFECVCKREYSHEEVSSKYRAGNRYLINEWVSGEREAFYEVCRRLEREAMEGMLRK